MCLLPKNCCFGACKQMRKRYLKNDKSPSEKSTRPSPPSHNAGTIIAKQKYNPSFTLEKINKSRGHCTLEKETLTYVSTSFTVLEYTERMEVFKGCVIISVVQLPTGMIFFRSSELRVLQVQHNCCNIPISVSLHFSLLGKRCYEDQPCTM